MSQTRDRLGPLETIASVVPIYAGVVQRLCRRCASVVQHLCRVVPRLCNVVQVVCELRDSPGFSAGMNAGFSAGGIPRFHRLFPVFYDISLCSTAPILCDEST